MSAFEETRFHSNFIKLTQKMTYKKVKVLVYVESLDDIDFWSNILESCGVKCSYDVQIYSHNQSSGKSSLIRLYNNNNLSESLIIAIDADYDLFSKRDSDVLSCSFVLHTVAHSRENLLCDPIRVAKLVTLFAKFSLNDEIFLLNKLNDFYNKLSTNSYSLLHSKAMLLLNSTRDSLDIKKRDYRNLVSDSSALETEFNSEVSVFLDTLGISVGNAFMYVRGHNIFNCIMAFLSNLKGTCQAFLSKKIEIDKTKVGEETKLSMNRNLLDDLDIFNYIKYNYILDNTNPICVEIKNKILLFENENHIS